MIDPFRVHILLNPVLIFITLNILPVWAISLSFEAGIKQTKNHIPQVNITFPKDGVKVKWGSSVRYAIAVSDKEDGLSEYGELLPDEVLLEASYWPSVSEADNYLDTLQKVNKDLPGLALIKSSGCFNCHRDKTRLVGPSWKEMSSRYTPNTTTLEKLSNQVVTGSIGIWGDTPMPSNLDLSPKEVLLAIKYMLKQGGNDYSQIYPGFDGAVRLIKKPPGNSNGVFILTASYTDSGIDGVPDSRKRGKHSIMLKPIP